MVAVPFWGLIASIYIYELIIMKQPSFFKRNALRMTPAILIFVFIVYYTISTANWPALIAMVGLVATLLVMATGLYRKTQTIDQSDSLAVAQLLLLGKRLGGIFCSLALIIGVAFLMLAGYPFVRVALPALLIGNALTLWLLRTPVKK